MTRHRIAACLTAGALLTICTLPVLASGAREYENTARFQPESGTPIWIESALADIIIEGGRGGVVEARVSASPRIVEQIQPVVAGQEQTDGLHLKIIAGPDAPAATRQSGAASVSRSPDDFLRLYLRIPNGTHVALATGTGNVEVSDFAGRLTIAATEGDVRLTDVSGQITVSATIGDVTTRGLELTASSRVVSSTGSLDLQIDSGAEHLAEASSASGQVQIR